MIFTQSTRLTSSLFSLLFITGCAQVSDVKTNLDRENFKQYFAHGQVQIFEKESKFIGKYKMIGGVEGENCQVKPYHAAPDKIEARTNARRSAFELGANAIVFSGCTTVQTKQCHANIICYGKAYQVEQPSD
ncbi:Rcs stress response system protein RcsF [Thalassotalea atypica]|uniref:Rcs stress response system protein RcsF n=1 Tax=Thalassotalea atypica TaxID=2054316 RepID=UPI0025745CBE|nr:Rcs stress response system protein RcsF [Thalassotalea atypica]